MSTLNKKRLTFIIIAIILILIFIPILIYMMNYNAKSINKEFFKLLKNKDVSSISKLVSNENVNYTEKEISDLLETFDEQTLKNIDNYVNSNDWKLKNKMNTTIFYINSNSNFLGIFKKYQVQTADFQVLLNNFNDNFKISLDDVEISPEKINSNSIRVSKLTDHKLSVSINTVSQATYDIKLKDIKDGKYPLDLNSTKYNITVNSNLDDNEYNITDKIIKISDNTFTLDKDNSFEFNGISNQTISGTMQISIHDKTYTSKPFKLKLTDKLLCDLTVDFEDSTISEIKELHEKKKEDDDKVSLASLKKDITSFLEEVHKHRIKSVNDSINKPVNYLEPYYKPTAKEYQIFLSYINSLSKKDPKVKWDDNWFLISDIDIKDDTYTVYTKESFIIKNVEKGLIFNYRFKYTLKKSDELPFIIVEQIDLD